MATTIYRCAIRSSLYGRVIVNTLHVKADGFTSPDDRNATDTADDVWAWLGTAYRAVLAEEGTVLDLSVVEELAPADESVPDAAVKSINAAGTLSTPNNLPVELTMHLQSKTGVPLRGAHGGMFLPPPLSSTFLTGDGLQFNNTSAYWTNAGTLASALLAGHDWSVIGVPSGHESYVIYSRTRRARGLSNYYFDVKSVVRNPLPTWLRSRAS